MLLRIVAFLSEPAVSVEKVNRVLTLNALRNHNRLNSFLDSYHVVGDEHVSNGIGAQLIQVINLVEFILIRPGKSVHLFLIFVANIV